MVINSAGNVGIGTINPAEKLEVSGVSNTRIRVKASETGSAAFVMLVSGNTQAGMYSHMTGEGDIRFYTGAGWQDRMRIDSEGNIGINTVAPEAKLDVNGTVKFNVSEYADNTAAIDAGLIAGMIYRDTNFFLKIVTTRNAYVAGAGNYNVECDSSLPNGTTDAIGAWCGGGIKYAAGLVVATANETTELAWGSLGTSRNVISNSAGEANTDVLGPYGAGAHPAASAAYVKTLYGYSDWYLPAKDQLNTVYTNEADIVTNGGAAFEDDLYWSSTEDNSSPNTSNETFAWAQNFNGGAQSTTTKDVTHWVRLIRSY